jgi:hypothetical protein
MKKSNRPTPLRTLRRLGATLTRHEIKSVTQSVSRLPLTLSRTRLCCRHSALCCLFAFFVSTFPVSLPCETDRLPVLFVCLFVLPCDFALPVLLFCLATSLYPFCVVVLPCDFSPRSLARSTRFVVLPCDSYFPSNKNKNKMLLYLQKGSLDPYSWKWID